MNLLLVSITLMQTQMIEVVNFIQTVPASVVAAQNMIILEFAIIIIPFRVQLTMLIVEMKSLYLKVNMMKM